MLSDVVGSAHMRTVQRGSGARFALEPIPAIGIGCQRSRQDFDGAVEARIPRLGDFAPLARADLRDDFERANQRAGGYTHGR